MAIGKSSKKSFKAPKYLDLSSGFYGRLDETEPEKGTEEEAVEQGLAETGTVQREMQTGETQSAANRGSGLFDFNQGMLEDDGTASLLRKSPSRRSSRWRRRSSSRRKRAEAELEDSAPGTESVSPARPPETVVAVNLTAAQAQDVGHIVVHFSVREEADDQVLICEKPEMELEAQRGEEEMKVAKKSKLKNYRRALDRALRRGWEAFISNLHNVTLTPISPSETSQSSSSPARASRSSAIVDYR